MTAAVHAICTAHEVEAAFRVRVELVNYKKVTLVQCRGRGAGSLLGHQALPVSRHGTVHTESTQEHSRQRRTGTHNGHRSTEQG